MQLPCELLGSASAALLKGESECEAASVSAHGAIIAEGEQCTAKQPQLRRVSATQFGSAMRKSAILTRSHPPRAGGHDCGGSRVAGAATASIGHPTALFAGRMHERSRANRARRWLYARAIDASEQTRVTFRSLRERQRPAEDLPAFDQRLPGARIAARSGNAHLGRQSGHAVGAQEALVYVAL